MSLRILIVVRCVVNTACRITRKKVPKLCVTIVKHRVILLLRAKQSKNMVCQKNQGWWAKRCHSLRLVTTFLRDFSASVRGAVRGKWRIWYLSFFLHKCQLRFGCWGPSMLTVCASSRVATSLVHPSSQPPSPAIPRPEFLPMGSDLARPPRRSSRVVGFLSPHRRQRRRYCSLNGVASGSGK
jgi:hypothetical protein